MCAPLFLLFTIIHKFTMLVDCDSGFFSGNIMILDTQCTTCTAFQKAVDLLMCVWRYVMSHACPPTAVQKRGRVAPAMGSDKEFVTVCKSYGL